MAGVAVWLPYPVPFLQPAVVAAKLFGSLRYLSDDDSVGGALVEHLLNRANIVMKVEADW